MPVAGMVETRGVQHGAEDAEDGHDQHELQGALLATPHEEPVHHLREDRQHLTICIRTEPCAL